MIEETDILSLNFLKKQAFTGSFRGMRYILYKVEEENQALAAEVWPQPYCYEAAPEEIRTRQDFPFTDEGRLAAISWLNERYEAEKQRWSEAGF